MSDAATEARYEERLRHCRDQGHPPLHFFRVNDVEIAVCPSCEIRLIEDVTAGDGSEWDQSAREALEASIDAHPAGKSASGTVTCCEPRFLQTPSGAVFSHSRFCPTHPGQKIDTKTYAQGRGGEPWRGRRLRGIR